jgi:prokaryotic YEATS domain
MWFTGSKFRTATSEIWRLSRALPISIWGCIGSLSSELQILIWGFFGSATLLLIFIGLHVARSSVIGLPTQWLWVSSVPLFLALIVGGYIAKIKGPIEVEFAPQLRNLPYRPPIIDMAKFASGAIPESTTPGMHPAPEWGVAREKEYKRTRQFSLVHVYQPSERPGQRFDVAIYLARHVRGSKRDEVTNFQEIDRAEFFFGEFWGNVPFEAYNDGGYIGVRTSAWGPFLAMCRIYFKDSPNPETIFRYIDFEMATLKS